MSKFITVFKAFLFAGALVIALLSSFPGASTAAQAPACCVGGTYCQVAVPGGVIYTPGYSDCCIPLEQ